MTNYRRNSPSPSDSRRFGPRGRRLRGSFLLGLLLAGYAAYNYFSNAEFNVITGETQHVSISAEQEVAIGLQSLPAMVNAHGGLHPDEQAQQYVKSVGRRIVENSQARETPYSYDFHLLADSAVVNAFALPGGQVFITAALYNQLESEDQLAGVFGHEVGHVVARHGAERIAKQELTEGLTGAAVLASGDYTTGEAAQMIAGLVHMSYGRDQELESDELGVRFMLEAGYAPEALVGVMEILDRASKGNRKIEFLSTHPSPDNRIQKIREAIARHSGNKQ